MRLLASTMRSWHLPLVACLAFCLGCQTEQTVVEDAQFEQYEQRMTEEDPIQAAPELSQLSDQPPVDLVGEVKAGEGPSLASMLWLALPDPSQAAAAFDRRLKNTQFSPNIEDEYKRVFEEASQHIEEIAREKQFRLTLDDTLRRALANNYAIKMEGYAPAISTAQVVQAEAAFDLAFFANMNRNNADQPTPAPFRASQTDTTAIAGGIRKLLATGASVTLTESMTRVDDPGIQGPTQKPTWAHNFQAELRQPLLRNFGIDFNRSQINIRKNERESNRESFRARVIDILNQTEQAYWTLVAARRNVVVSAELLAQANRTLQQIEARAEFDAYPSLLQRSRANAKTREFEFIDVKNQVRNAEDQLLNLLNDPELPLSADFEILPVDNPVVIESIRDRFHSVETALERRPEIIQARYTVDNARLQLGIAKNQALPQLDVIYRMTLNGIGASSDQAFDQMTASNFIDQYVGLEFLWNIGERAERAGIRIARFQQSQAVLGYKQSLDGIITDCRVALRDLESSYEQLGPSYDAVYSSAENLRSLQERQERKSPEALETVLGAQTGLAAARQGLLQAVIRYNQGIVNVERAQGTLLEYNNVVLTEQP